MDSENKIAETMRSIENIWRLFYEDQNSRNSPTLDEDKLGFKRVINNVAEHAVQSQLKVYIQHFIQLMIKYLNLLSNWFKGFEFFLLPVIKQTFEDKYFKSPPKKCPNCGKMKKAGRKMVIAVDAARRFAYFGKHPQQPSSVQLVSHSVKDGHSGNQQKSVAVVPRFQSGQETMDALERHSKWEHIPYAQERLSPRIMKKNETQQRISSPKKKKFGPSRQRYSNSSNDVILAPTLMRFEPDIVESYSDSSSCSESRSRSRSISPAKSATSSTGSNSPSRYRRTSSLESTYSASSSGSVAPNTSYNESSCGNEREPQPRGRTLDHRRRSPDYSCSSSRSTSRSRSPDEVYSHRKSRDSKLYPSNHSTDKVGWFRRIKNKLGFHHQDDHHHHPGRHNTGVSSSKEDETVHTHHRSIANPVSNGKLHRKSNDQAVRKTNRRTQVKNEPKQHGHVRKFFGGVVGHFLGSNKSKPSTAGKRRLERTVTGKGNVVRKKLHWWQKIHRRGSSNVGKSRAKLGMKTKYPKSKGYKHNTKMKKLL
ncbi:hypothetical protein MKW98_006635 [Papaver atlanticum]|uniref:Uncharacterized protein n=1 Tax=Papaver atlanticum TaxID=357466 RepID=A0AAD4TB01_9MAGN|nr:hypothetical protein MKW98_006635 [Papaver atlanticum]